MELELTSWCGLEVRHPRPWELSVFSGAGERGRCCFSDRLYQRLDVRWRPLTYVPQMDAMLQKYRLDEKKHERAQLQDLQGPPEWTGAVRTGDPGCVVHAGRYFKQPRMLVEATLVWPQGRDEELEREILASVRMEDPAAKVKLWQALGLSATVPAEMELVKSGSTVGRVTWEFRSPKKRGDQLTLERLAMPDCWLKASLGQWLREQLPPGVQVLWQGEAQWGAHRTEQLIGIGKIDTVSSLRGLRQVRLEAAWLCQAEGRVYRVCYSRASSDEAIVLPEALAVTCCRPVAEIGHE